MKRPNKLIERVYTEFRPQYQTVGSQLNLVIPQVNVSNATNIGSGTITPIAPTDALVSVTLSNKIASTRIITAYDQTLAGVPDLADKYLQPCIEEVMREVNGTIGALMTYQNFGTYSAVTGGTKTFTRANLAAGWQALYAAGVPFNDANDVTFATGAVPYSNMLSATEFLYSYINGEDAGTTAIQKAMIMDQFNTTIIADPDVPVVSTSTYAGLMFHRYAIALRTAVEYSMADALIQELTIYPRKDFPVTIQMGNVYLSQGKVVNVFNLNGLAVARPEMAQYFQST